MMIRILNVFYGLNLYTQYLFIKMTVIYSSMANYYCPAVHFIYISFSILCLGYSERYFVIFVTVERMTLQTVAHNSFFFCAKIVASLTRPEPIVLWTIYCETRCPPLAKTRQCWCGGRRVAVRTRRWAPELHSPSNKCWTPRRRQGRPPPPLPALASLTSQSAADSQT